MSIKLSSEQGNAVNSMYGQIMLISCPGSGKTTTVIQRAVNMVNSGVDPNSMLNITFTRAAAAEMESRYSKFCNKKLEFSTIHSFCYRILSKRYGYGQKDIFKQSDAWAFVAESLKGTGVGINQLEDMTKEVLCGISFVKNKGIDPTTFEPDKCDKKAFLSIFDSYERHKHDLGQIDLDDMVILFREKLRIDKAFLHWCRATFKFITIDEFQDVDRVQADIFYDICGPDGNIFVVGDDDQSIYGFRAAEPGIMLNFEKHFPKCKKIYMGTNYRSCKSIVKVAGNLIAHNENRFQKTFEASRTDTGDIYVIKADTQAQQSAAICAEVKDLHAKGMDYNDMAILFRTNTLSMPFITALVKEDIPFYMAEHVNGIHQDPIFIDIVTYWRLANGKEQKGDLQRVINHPSRYIKQDVFAGCKFERKAMMQRSRSLKEFAREKITDMLWDVNALKGKAPSDFMRSLDLGMGYRKWLKEKAEYIGRDANDFFEIFDALVDEAKGFDSMEDWFKYANKYEHMIKSAVKSNAKTGVCLTTFHSSKGLEWRSVFVTNVNRNVCPYKKAKTVEALEEERRMFYVAITRAKDTLYLSYVTGGKDGNDMYPSDYISEMGIR